MLPWEPALEGERESLGPVSRRSKAQVCGYVFVAACVFVSASVCGCGREGEGEQKRDREIETEGGGKEEGR